MSDFTNDDMAEDVYPSCFYPYINILLPKLIVQSMCDTLSSMFPLIIAFHATLGTVP